MVHTKRCDKKFLDKLQISSLKEKIEENISISKEMEKDIDFQWIGKCKPKEKEAAELIVIGQ